MEDKIEKICCDLEIGIIDWKEATEKLLDLFNVSQQRELLLAYEKQHYTPIEWALASKQCKKEIDDFLAKQKPLNK